MEEARGKASRTLVLLLIAVLIAAMVSAFVFIFGRRVESRAVVLPMAQEENLMILENGGAVLRLSTTTSPSQLANLYSQSLDEMGENAFMGAFREGVQKEYKILTGIDVNVVDSQISIGPDNEAKLSIEATAQQVAKFNASENVWEIDVRPPEENEKEAAGFMLIQMMFAQQMLKSLPEDQRLDYTTSIPIKLPDGATIINADELSGKVWRVDFGGGSYREASLSVVSSSEVRLTERVVVTEQPPAAPDENLFEALFNYKIFTIKYRLPGQAPGFAAATIDDKKAPAAKPNTDFSWSFDWTISYPFSIPFTYTVSVPMDGTTGQVTAEVELTGTAEFTFKWYIGWDFAWVQKTGWGGIPYWAYELQWFRTYVEINPELNVNAATTITGQLTHEWEQDIYNWSNPVTVFIGPVPVVIEVRLDIGAGVEVGVEASISVSAGVDASTTFKLGVEWTKDRGWQPIAERTFSFTHTGPEITTSAKAWVTPYLKLRLGAYFYWTAGPFVELKPLVTASLTPENWLIEAGFDINAGVGFGAISDWIDLPDWSTTLYSWRTPIASGTIAANHPPSLSSGSVSPTSGTTDTTFTYEVTYTDSDDDAPSYVKVYIDNTQYSMSKVSGTYTGGALYRYTTNLSVGSHTYYFQASDGKATARLPTSGSYNEPTVRTTNMPPTLTSGSVSPSSGLAGTTSFTYEVTYTDLDNDAPIYVKVYIDGTPHSMSKVSGNYMSGALYHYTTTLSAGSHTYYFEASDGTAVDRLPTSGSYPGPTVTSEGVPPPGENQLLWSYTTGGEVHSVSISSDGSYIAAGSGQDKRIYLFSRTSGTPLWSYQAGLWVQSVSISSDGSYIAAESTDSKIYLFSRTSNTPLWSSMTLAYLVAISSNGSYIAAGGLVKGLYLFSKDDNTPLWRYTTDGVVNSIAISSDGSYVAAGDTGKIYLFSKDDNTPLWSYTTDSVVYSVAISSDGSYMAAGDGNRKVYLFSRTSSIPLWSYTTDGLVNSVATSSDGSYVAAGDSNGKIYLFSKDDNTPLWSYTTGQYGFIYSIAISSDGSYIAAGAYILVPGNGKVCLFSRSSSTPLWSYTTGGRVYSIAISSDGSYIAAGGEDRRVYLFSRAS